MLQKTGVVYKHPLGCKESILIHAKVPLKAFFFSEFRPYLRMFTIVSFIFIFWLSDVLPVQVLPLVLPVQCPLLLIWALAGFQDFNCGGVATQLALLSQEQTRVWCKLALTVSEWAPHRCCHDIGLCGTPSVNSRGGTRWCKLVVAVVAHQREGTTRSRCWCWGGWWDSGAPGVSHQPLPLCCCRRRRFPHNPPFLARLALHVALLFSLRLVLVSC